MTHVKSDERQAQQRFKPIPIEELTDQQRQFVDAVRSSPRAALKNSAAAIPGPLGGPFNVWLRSPEIADLIQQLGAAIRFRSSITPKLNELAILVTARYWTAQFEWRQHHALAIEAGLDPEIAASLAKGRRPPTMSPEESIVHDFSRELHNDKAVSDATYERALRLLGEQQVVDLIVVNGFYGMVAATLNVDRTPIPPGEPLPLLPFEQ